MFTNLLKDRIFLLLFTFIFLTSCSTWDNFTTYFNLYYNASELFQKAEKQITEQKKDIFSTEPSTIPPAAGADLQKVIEKCSHILQFSPNSSYVEDALMMLGKSFYYQKNYLKGRRKFEELISSQSNSDYVLEASLWIGKCDMRLKNYTDGLKTLKDVRDKAIEEGEEEFMQEAFIEEIVYYKSVDDYTTAIQTANEFLSVSDDDVINAIVWNEVGNLNVTIEDYMAAVKAYRNVFEYSPDYELEVTAKISLGKVLREIGENQEALTLFEDMRSEDKYLDKYSEIDLEIGITESTLGKYDEAISQLTIVDTTYKNTPNSAVAKYEIALVYEYGLNQLDSAAVYYKKASVSQLPKEYISLARDKDRLFTRYISLRKDLNKYDKQLFYFENPEEFKKDSALYVQDSLAIAEEIANAKEFQESWSGLSDLLVGTEDTTGYYQDSLIVADTLITFLKDSLEYENVNRDSIFSWVKNPKPQDSLLVAKFDSMFTNRTFDPAAKQKLEQQKREREALANQLTASLPDTLKFKNNPPRMPNITKDSLKTLLAKDQLNLGNLFLSEFDMPDSAYKYYYSNLTVYPNNSYYASSLFALGSYYLTIDNQESADSLFNIIYDNYKNESIVNAAAVKLDKPLIDLDYDPALEQYTQAEKLIFAHDYSSALFELNKIPKDFPQSAVAPKAIFASGWIEENELDDPEAAIEYYDTLIARYPASDFVRIVAPKVSFYKQEKRREELALADSLNELTSPDSLKSDSIQVAEETITPKDTVQVSVAEEEQTPVQGDDTGGGNNKTPAVKEPVWNPRKR
jgi:tetratricopeptide (TPR) repeat protein